MKIVSVVFNHRLLKNSISPFYEKKKDMIKERKVELKVTFGI